MDEDSAAAARISLPDSPSSSTSPHSPDRTPVHHAPVHLRVPSNAADSAYIDVDVYPSPSLNAAPPPSPQQVSSLSLPSTSLPVSAFPATTSRRTRRSSITRLVQAAVYVHRNVPQTASSHSAETTRSIAHDVLVHQLPTLFSPRPIRRTFARNLDTVLRGTVTFIIAAVIAVQPWATDVLALPYLFAMFTAQVIRPTVGSTLIYIDTQGKGVLAAAVIDVIITGAQVSQLSSTPRIIVCELLLFSTSLLIAYYFHLPAARRFSLACHALTLVLVANGNQNVYLPFQIALNFMLSYIISLVLVSIPFPRLAKDELLDRYQQALLTLSQTLVGVVDAYLQVEPIAPVVLHNKAQSALADVSKSLAIMRRLETEAAMESEVWHWLFPHSHSLGSPIVADPDKCEEICQQQWTPPISSIHLCVQLISVCVARCVQTGR